MNPKQRLIVGAIFIAIAWAGIEYSSNSYDENRLKSLENLCASHSQTSSQIKEEYLLNEDLGTAKYSYTFVVDGKTYEKEYVTTDDAEVKIYRQIWYEIENPRNNIFSEPCASLENYSKQKFKSLGPGFEIASFIIGFIGLGVFIRGLLLLLKSKFLKDNGQLK